MSAFHEIVGPWLWVWLAGLALSVIVTIVLAMSEKDGESGAWKVFVGSFFIGTFAVMTILSIILNLLRAYGISVRTPLF